MKYQVAFAMSYHPEYLLLDEPTAGFDPVFRKDFIKIIQEIRERKIGILMSTHILSDSAIHCADGGSGFYSDCMSIGRRRGERRDGFTVSLFYRD